MAEFEQSEEYNEKAESIRVLFREALTHAQPSLERLERLQQAYDCMLPEQWSTYSEIYLPFVRTAVEQALPDIMNYLFPPRNMISLRPHEPMPYKEVERVQNYLEDLVRSKVQLKREGLLTLKDAVKLNVGYGIVETEIITPMTTFMNSIFSTEGKTDIRQLGLGEPVETISYRYVNWRQVVPMPDGSTPEKCSGVFFLDDVREDVFRDMYRMDAEKDNPVYMGDPEEIIDAVRDGKVSMSHFPIWWVMHSYATNGDAVNSAEALNMIAKMSRDASGPVRVPILKAYFKNEHVWMTPDGTIIYHLKNDLQTLKCPIKKACPVPDSDKWYNVGDVESGKDAADGANIFLNALMDMVSMALHPPTIVNRQVVKNSDATFEPHAVIDVHGKVGDAVEYVQAPALPSYLGGIGASLEEQFASANGQPRALQGQGTAGVMRGGGMAFDSLLQTTMARSKLASSVLEMGWLQDTVSHILIMAQIIGMEDSYIVRDDVSKDYIEKTITANELRHKFDVAIKLDDKLRESPADKALQLQIYQMALRGDPTLDQDAVKAWLIGDAELSQRLKASPEVFQAQVQRLQQMQQAQQQQREGGLNYAQQAQDGVNAEAGVNNV